MSRNKIYLSNVKTKGMSIGMRETAKTTNDINEGCML